MPPAIRQGVYAILDLDRIAPLLPEAPGAERAMLHAYAEAAADGGACVLQIRSKSSPASSLYLSRLYGELLEKWGDKLTVVINDHPQAARAFAGRPGIGAHLGQDDGSPVTARHQLGDKAVIGWSTHNLSQVADAANVPVDYIGYGPVLATTSKKLPDDVVGFDGLAAACAASTVPVVAIGGLTLDDIEQVRQARAHAIAVISAWLGPADDPWPPQQAGVAISMLTATWLALRPES
ncbi:MAG: thiamine phosphate synthase [Myxococcales bacterium]|nr:thiamine phosphate synthase [Myxococcales bacterium]